MSDELEFVAPREFTVLDSLDVLDKKELKDITRNGGGSVGRLTVIVEKENQKSVISILSRLGFSVFRIGSVWVNADGSPE